MYQYVIGLYVYLFLFLSILIECSIGLDFGGLHCLAIGFSLSVTFL